jgi:hypothetical protein
LAILISIASAVFTWMGYTLNKQASRASVQVTQVELLEDWNFDPRNETDQKPISIRLTVGNSGKLRASRIEMFIAPNVCYDSTNIDPSSGVHFKPCATAGGKTVGIDDLGASSPSREYEMEIDTKDLASFLLSQKDFPGKISNVTVLPTINYTDSTESYRETQCFSGQANLNGFVFKGIAYACNKLGNNVIVVGGREFRVEVTR